MTLLVSLEADLSLVELAAHVTLKAASVFAMCCASVEP